VTKNGLFAGFFHLFSKYMVLYDQFTKNGIGMKHLRLHELRAMSNFSMKKKKSLITVHFARVYW